MKLSPNILLLIVAAFLVSCGTMQTYEGDKLSRDEVAIIKSNYSNIFNIAVVKEIDGRSMAADQVNAEVLPGTHTVKIDVTSGVGVITHLATEKIIFHAEAGHTYKAHGTIKDGESIVWLVDETSGRIVSGEKYQHTSQSIVASIDKKSFRPIPDKYTYQEPSWLKNNGEKIRIKLRNIKGIMSGINGVWRPSNCYCGPCDAWIWSEGNTFYVDATRSGNPEASGTVAEMSEGGLYAQERGEKTYISTTYIILENGSAKKFMLTTFYDNIKKKITALHFYYAHDGSEYTMYKCSDF